MSKIMYHIYNILYKVKKYFHTPLDKVKLHRHFDHYNNIVAYVENKLLVYKFTDFIENVLC